VLAVSSRQRGRYQVDMVKKLLIPAMDHGSTLGGSGLAFLQASQPYNLMSLLGGKADIGWTYTNVRL
jgi:hypothetical protein